MHNLINCLCQYIFEESHKNLITLKSHAEIFLIFTIWLVDQFQKDSKYLFNLHSNLSFSSSTQFPTPTQILLSSSFHFFRLKRLLLSMIFSN